MQSQDNMEGQNKQEYSDSRCQNLSSVIQNISQATIKNAQNRSSCDKDTYTIANKVYRHIIFHVANLTCVINDYNTSETFLKVFPNSSFAK